MTKDAFFKAGEENQDLGYVQSLIKSARKYSILYYGPENEGTLNDKITEPLEEVTKTNGKLKTKEINKYLFNDFEEE